MFTSGTSLELFNIRCGVPQDSVSGPFLFWIDINDIGSASSKLSFTLVADDTNIFKKDRAVNRKN